MERPSQLKTLRSPPAFSASSSSTFRSMKIKTIIQNLFYSQISRVIRVLSKAKSLVIQIYKKNQLIHFLLYPKKKLKNKKTFVGSFRLHYNWCSSHVQPISSPSLNGISEAHLFYDSTWNTVFSTEQCPENSESQLSGYLQWLEDKPSEEDIEVNDVDKLADMFIANCREKFLLEKVESYRRFQEMLARSV